ncbi:MAG: PH domain-containing protein [Roseburia sp.]|nr:PH domain-containing protein [Roseburia sp.]
MGYIENNLAKDEKVLARISHSWAGMISTLIWFIFTFGFGVVCFCYKPIMEAISKGASSWDSLDLLSFIAFGFVGAVFILLALAVLINNISEIKSAQLVVTNKRIFGRRGAIAKRTTDVLISKVDTINVSTGLFGALFHYGTVEIVSSASGAMTRIERGTLKYSFVANTDEFRKSVLEAIEKVKKEELEAQARSLSNAMGR